MPDHATADPPEDYPDPPVDVETVSPSELQRRLDAGEPVRLLDVRDRDEVAAWAIEGPGVTRTQLPYARFLEAQVTDGVPSLSAEVDGEGPITVVCGYGAASGYVAGLLADAGVEARNLAGGMRGWARVYEARPVRDSAPTILQYRRPASGCLGYLVLDGGEAVVVDPLRAFADRYAADATERGASLVAAVDTHLHADHVSGLRDVAAADGVTAYLPEATLDRRVDVAATPIADGDEIAVGSTALEAVALPGHTTDMTGFAVDGHLLTGDSLFVDGIARPDLQETDEGPAGLAASLHETLTERLSSFTDDTVVCPGHVGDPTVVDPSGTVTATLGALRDGLWIFGTDRETAVARLRGDLPPEPANAERIVPVNAGREDVDAGTAFELELGPNNCAASAD
jgi:glyoxylase-like metal-dependent hydrolase (beta-lactamase superfamily II)/rhodanese-related sulfurtransferase